MQLCDPFTMQGDVTFLFHFEDGDAEAEGREKDGSRLLFWGNLLWSVCFQAAPEGLGGCICSGTYPSKEPKAVKIIFLAPFYLGAEQICYFFFVCLYVLK